MDNTVQECVFEALKTVASSIPGANEMLASGKCSKENFSRTIRKANPKFLQEMLIYLAEGGNEEDVTTLDEGSVSIRSPQMSQSAHVPVRSGQKEPMSKTWNPSSGKPKDKTSSSAPDSLRNQLSMDMDTLKMKYPQSEWQSILQKLYKHLEDTDKHLQEKQDNLKTDRSSPNAGNTSKSAQEGKRETGVEKKAKGSQDPDWKSYFQKLEGHLEYRDKLCEDLNQELEENCKRYNHIDSDRRHLSDELEKKKKLLKDNDERANDLERTLNNKYEEFMDMKKKKEKAEADNDRLSKDNLCRQDEIKKLTQEKYFLQGEKNDQLTKIGKLKSHIEQVQAHEKHQIESLKESFDSERRTLNQKLAELDKEKNDLRDRFSKVAGQKLQEKNADIADLSDPNRAMKLSEKLSQIYDDDWTDAFQALGDRKMKSKEAIHLLLHILKDCYETCEEIAAQQLEELKIPLIQPVKTVAGASKGHVGMKGKQRISSKHERILKDARRQMWDASVDTVKQVIMEKLKEWMKKEAGPKTFDDTKEYIEKCAEICWLMVIHEPPIYMKMDTKQGVKLDANLYTPYSASGEKIDYLVWPPLFNGKEGGLLSKGVVEPQKTIKRDQK